jgi:DNA repair protein RadC
LRRRTEFFIIIIVGETKVKDLPAHERPRERLLKDGPGFLSDAQLLALLIGSGTSELSAVSLARKMLRRRSLVELAKVSRQELVAVPGVGEAIAARIAAALELGARLHQKDLLPPPLTSPEQVLLVVRRLAAYRQERLVVLYLDSRHRLVKEVTAAVGSLNATLVHPREIFAPAFSLPVAGIVLAHNHPSGDREPSRDDVKFTRRIDEAGRILGVNLIDHLIVTKSGYYSFREADLL